MATTTHLPDLITAGLATLPGRLMAFFMPTDCLRSLEKWPPLHRAFRQSVGNPAAIQGLYDCKQQQPEGPGASGFQTRRVNKMRQAGTSYFVLWLLIGCWKFSTWKKRCGPMLSR